MSFVHLHVHTQYSLLDGAARIKDLVSRAVEFGMPAIAITDHGAMYGVVEFYRECKKQGVKPVIGMEAYVAQGSRHDRIGMRDSSHLILLCKNETGYKNLMVLSSLAFTEGYYYRPRIDYDLLEQYHEGLICMSACLAGDIPRLLLANRRSDALALAKRLKGIFGEDFYIELQNHGLQEQLAVLPQLAAIAEELGIKTVATNDIHYVDKADAPAQDILLCIQTNRYVDETDRMSMGREEFYLKSESDMLAALPDYKEALENTIEVADKCELELKFGERRMPGFTAPDGMDNTEYLKQICYQGRKLKLGDAIDPVIDERLEYELGVIERMGFIDYFLIVWDFIHFAKSNGIVVGPGRGSGAGSLVAYCMDITDVNPIKYDLLFERFLNPERISMPDFDIDFCFERRQEVIDYVGRKYGADHVAQIITFGTMAARAAIRDVGRVLRMPYGEVDKISKLVPTVLNITLDEALNISGELNTLYKNDPNVTKLIDLARKLEGLPRHSSTHAAGVVICARPIVEYVPLQKNDDAVTTQFPMGTLEELGLLKMDFLGLRTLTVIRDALALIQSGGTTIDFTHMEHDDAGVYAMISRGDTDGVFQLESAGMRQFMMQLRPDRFEDIIAGISLYRPGPMDQIPRYVAGKNDPASVKYAHDKLRPILGTTYGCMVYQEQVMQIVRDLAGYSLGRSDLVRRAMAKKKQEVMAKEREYFINGIVEPDGTVTVPGAVRNGVSAPVANRIFDEMMDFASYAFNKSHAAAYAVLAYRTAYLKLHYPVEFMCALINSFMSNSDKIAEYIYSCNSHGIKVLPPDINSSQPRFSAENGCIRYGLAGIRNAGGPSVSSIVAEREQNGKFLDFYDFLRRCENLNKRMVESMIKSGCFDSMSVRRSQLTAVYEKAMDSASGERQRRASGQLSLFAAIDEVSGSSTEKLPDIPEFSPEVMYSMERAATGLYISGHPLREYERIIRLLGTNAAYILESDQNHGVKDNERVKLAGVIAGVTRKPTRSGGIMGVVQLEDFTGTVEMVVFQQKLEQYGDLLKEENLVLVSGRMSMREDQNNSLVLESMEPLKKAVFTTYLMLTESTRDKKPQITEILRRYPGNIRVVLYDSVIKKSFVAPPEMRINASEACMDELRALVGAQNVKVN